MAPYIHCSIARAIVYKRQYLKLHNKKRETERQKIIQDHLKRNPNLSGSELSKLASCSSVLANQIKKQYTEANNIFKENKLQKIFALLDKNPALKNNEIMKLANCNRSVAWRYKQRWLEQQNAAPSESAE